MSIALQEMKSHDDEERLVRNNEEKEEEDITNRGLYHLAKRYSGLDDNNDKGFVLPANFDALQEYYRMYTKLGDINYDPTKESNNSISTVGDDLSSDMVMTIGAFEGVSILSLESCETMAVESDRLFASSGGGELTPREVVSGLKRYAQAIKFELDETRRREWIRRYEVHKFDFDADNRDDADKAYYASQDAHNTSNPVRLRLFYYQMSIKFTNDMREKQNRLDEYLAFCDSLKKK
jgi:hypothetical protein